MQGLLVVSIIDGKNQLYLPLPYNRILILISSRFTLRWSLYLSLFHHNLCSFLQVFQNSTSTPLILIHPFPLVPSIFPRVHSYKYILIHSCNNQPSKISSLAFSIYAHWLPICIRKYRLYPEPGKRCCLQWHNNLKSMCLIVPIIRLGLAVFLNLLSPIGSLHR